jgi:hypothetical protein
METSPVSRCYPVVVKQVRFLIAVLAFAFSSRAASVGVAAVDEAGVPLKDILVVVQNLEPREQEICRALTGSGWSRL